MKDKTFKLVSKFFITLAIIYWVCIVGAVLTGCHHTEVNEYEGIDNRLQSLYYDSKKYKHPNEITIPLDEPLGARDYWERENLLRQFDY